MCACAGLSTDRNARLSPAAFRNCPSPGRGIFKHNAGQVRMDLELGRIGFMSTQRRASYWKRSSCTQGANASGHTGPGLAARNGRADANGGTAPLELSVSFHPSDKNLSPGTPERLATNSLQSDYRIARLVRLVPFDIRQSSRSSPPTPGAERAATGRPAMHGSSLRHIPIPPGSEHLHPPLP